MLWVPIECYSLEYYDDDDGSSAAASANVTKLIAEQKRSTQNEFHYCIRKYGVYLRDDAFLQFFEFTKLFSSLLIYLNLLNFVKAFQISIHYIFLCFSKLGKKSCDLLKEENNTFHYNI